MNRKSTPEKPLSPSVTTEIMNVKAVIPQRSNKHKHCFGSSCSMSWAISSKCASRLVFSRHPRQAQPHRVQPLVHESRKHCLFSKAKLNADFVCRFCKVNSTWRGKGRPYLICLTISIKLDFFFPFKQRP